METLKDIQVVAGNGKFSNRIGLSLPIVRDENSRNFVLGENPDLYPLRDIEGFTKEGLITLIEPFVAISSVISDYNYTFNKDKEYSQLLDYDVSLFFYTNVTRKILNNNSLLDIGVECETNKRGINVRLVNSEDFKKSILPNLIDYIQSQANYELKENCFEEGMLFISKDSKFSELSRIMRELAVHSLDVEVYCQALDYCGIALRNGLKSEVYDAWLVSAMKSRKLLDDVNHYQERSKDLEKKLLE